MTLSVAIVCEGNTDVDLVRTLADRMVVHHVEWIETENLGDYRKYRGFLLSESFGKLTTLLNLATERRIKLHGKFDDRRSGGQAR